MRATPCVACAAQHIIDQLRRFISCERFSNARLVSTFRTPPKCLALRRVRCSCNEKTSLRVRINERPMMSAKRTTDSKSARSLSVSAGMFRSVSGRLIPMGRAAWGARPGQFGFCILAPTRAAPGASCQPAPPKPSDRRERSAGRRESAPRECLALVYAQRRDWSGAAPHRVDRAAKLNQHRLAGGGRIEMHLRSQQLVKP